MICKSVDFFEWRYRDIAYMREHEGFKGCSLHIRRFLKIVNTAHTKFLTLSTTSCGFIRYTIAIPFIVGCRRRRPQTNCWMDFGRFWICRMPRRKFLRSSFNQCLKQMAFMHCLGKRRDIMARISGGKPFPPSTMSSCPAERRIIPSIF